MQWFDLKLRKIYHGNVSGDGYSLNKCYWYIGKVSYLPHILIPLSFLFSSVETESFLNFLAVFWDTNILLNKKIHMKVLKNDIFHSRW